MESYFQSDITFTNPVDYVYKYDKLKERYGKKGVYQEDGSIKFEGQKHNTPDGSKFKAFIYSIPTYFFESCLDQKYYKNFDFYKKCKYKEKKYNDLSRDEITHRIYILRIDTSRSAEFDKKVSSRILNYNTENIISNNDTEDPRARFEKIINDPNLVLDAIMKSPSTLNDYIDYPDLHETLYEKLIELYETGKCENYDSFRGQIIHFFYNHQDEKAMKFFGAEFYDVKYLTHPLYYTELDTHIESAFLSGKIEHVEVISYLCPLNQPRFLNSHLFCLLQLSGLRDMQNMMIKFGYKPTEVELAMFKEEFSTQIEEDFVALSSFEFPNSTLNDSHQNLYGPPSNQTFFSKVMKGSVERVVWSLLNKGSFLELLDALMIRRYSVAKLSKTEDSEAFHSKTKSSGRYLEFADYPKASIEEGSNVTNMGNSYSSYLHKLKELKDSKVIVTVDSEERVLTEYLGDLYILHRYTHLWESKDLVFLKLENLYNKISDQKNYTTYEDLRRDIVEFYWLFINCVPFKRGTASAGEALAYGFWIFHGYSPTFIEKGKSLDLEALTSLKPESFLENYPQPTKVEGVNS